jgi:NAD(P)H-dependent FMN reductase
MNLAVIIGTTRQNRKTPNQAQWVVNTAQQMTDIAVELIDLRDYPMPIFDEPASPRYNQNRQIDPAAKKWLSKIKQFDAYVFVTAEYNHSIPAVLKNAIDYITWELQRKPAFVVSHGSGGGVRAMTHLHEILIESRAVVVAPQPGLGMFHMSNQIDADGNLNEEIKADPYGPQPALEKTLRELKWYSDTLSPARARVKPGLET